MKTIWAGTKRALLCLSVLVAAVGCGTHAEDAPLATEQSAVLGDHTITLSLPIGVPKENAVVSAAGTLVLQDRAKLQSGGASPAVAANAGNGETNAGVEARTRDIFSIGSVVLRERALAEGSVQSAGSVTLRIGAAVTGSVVQGAPLAPPQLFSWTVSFPAPTGGDVILEPDQQRALDPGSYGNVAVRSRAQLSLRAGTYYMEAFSLEPQATLRVDESQGPVFLYVQRELVFRGTLAKVAGPMSDFLLGFVGTGSVFIEAPFSGTIVAPAASLHLNPGTHNGSFFAKDIEVRPDAVLVHRPFPWDRLPPPNVPPVTPEPATPGLPPPPGFTFPNLRPIVGGHPFSPVTFGGRDILITSVPGVTSVGATATPSSSAAAAPSGTATCSGSYVDNLGWNYVHEAIDYETRSGANGGRSCSSCGPTLSPHADVPGATVGELSQLSVRRIHKARMSGVWSSFGHGVFSSFDNKLDLVTQNGVVTIRSFNVDQDTDGVVWTDVNTGTGDTQRDGRFHNREGFARSIELLDAAGRLVVEPRLAASAVLTTHGGETSTFEIIAPDGVEGSARAGRWARLTDRNGNATRLTYRFAANASTTELGGQRTRLWQLASVVDHYGVSAAFRYRSTLVNGRWAVEQIDLPNGSAIRYLYNTSKPGGGLVGPALDRVEFPDGTSSTFATTIDPTTQLLIVHYSDNASGPGGVRKRVYLNQAQLRAPNGSLVNQPTNVVRQVVNGDGEVVYASWEDPTDPNVAYFYEGGGSLVRLITRSGNVPVSFARAIAFDPVRQDPWTATFTGAEQYQIDDRRLMTSKTDALGRRTDWVRNATNRSITAIGYPDGTSQSFAYNQFLEPTRIADRAGQLFEYFYDARGNLERQQVAAGRPESAAWRATYNTRGQLLSRTDANGSATQFVYDARGFLSQIRRPADLSGGSRPTQRFEFDSIGRIQAAHDADGRRTGFEYDSRNRLTRVGHADGSNEVFTYGSGNNANLLVARTDRNGNRETFGYDVTSRLTSRTSAAGTASAVTEERRYLFGTTLVSSETQRGELTSFVYDVKKRLIETRRRAVSSRELSSFTSWDSVGRRYADTDPYGRSTYFVYDANDRRTRTVRERVSAGVPESPSPARLPRISEPDPAYTIEEAVHRATGEVAVTIDGRGSSTLYAYDGQSRLVEKIEAAGTAATATTRTEYDAQGNVRRVHRPRTFAEGQPFVTELTYTGRNLLASRTEAAGTSVSSTERMTYTNTGKVATRTDGRGAVTRLVYDTCCDRVVQEIDALGNSKRNAYDPNGNVVSVIDRNGNATTVTYDALNRRISSRNAEGETTRFAYDDDLTDGTGIDAAFPNAVAGLGLGAGANGSAKLTTNPLGETSLEIQDGLGRRVRSVDGNGNATTVIYDEVVDGLLETRTVDALGNVNAERADPAGLVREIVDAEGFVRFRSYDANGKQLSRLDANGVGESCDLDERGRAIECIDTQGDARRSWYDAENNLTAVTDALGNTITCNYDARNRRSSCRDRLGGTRSFRHDQSSNLVEVRDAEGQATLYTYDLRNGLTEERFADGRRVQRTFDAGERLASRTDQSGARVTFRYDRADRLVERVYPDGLNDTLGYDDASRITSGVSARYASALLMSYDAAGRLVEETQTAAGQSQTVAYGHDAANRQTTVTYPDGSVVSRRFTPRGAIDRVMLDAQTLSAREFDAGGRLVENTLGNGLVETTTYRADDLLERIHVPTVADLRYEYDGNKRKTREIDLLHAAQNQTFGYDTEGRVTSFERGSDLQQSWDLSLEGDWNNTRRNGELETRAHGPVHVLTAINARSLGYDPKGNLTDDGAGATYTWDFENRLVEAAVPGDSGVRRIRYAYDVLGRRVARSEGATTTMWVHDGAQLIAEYEGGGVTRKYVFAAELDEPIALVTSAATFYYTSNALRTVVALTTSTGAVFERYQYDAYGERQVLDAAGQPRGESLAGNVVGFTGRHHDAETGLVFFRFRYYSPEHGRFISRDRTYTDGLSLYAAYFVPNLMDPTGMLSLGAIVSVGKAAVGGVVSGGKAVVGAVVDGAKAAVAAAPGLLEKIGTFLLENSIVISLEGTLKAEVSLCDGTIIASANLELFVGGEIPGDGKIGLSKEFSGELDPIRFDGLDCANCNCCRPGLGGIKLAAEFDLMTRQIQGPLGAIGVECSFQAEADLCETNLGVSCFANLVRYVPVIGPAIESLDKLEGVKAQIGIEVGGEVGICNWPLKFGSDLVIFGAGKIALALGED